MTAADRSRPTDAVMPAAVAHLTTNHDWVDPSAVKDLLRAEVRRARAERPVAARRAADAMRTELVLQQLQQRPAGWPRCVACYLSVDPEPDTLQLTQLLYESGASVLVPLLRGHREPTFARFGGMESLRPGLWGIPEPVDAEPITAHLSLDRADVVLCSALAATPDGRRLGIGGGWYDRALTGRRPDAPVWALLNESEVVADLPTEPHDQRVQMVVTEMRAIPCS